MNADDPLLKVRFDGASIGAGRIPVEHLLRFLSNMRRVFQCTGSALDAAVESTKQRRLSQQTRAEIELDLVQLTEGSQAAVLCFERRQNETFLPQMDAGAKILETSIRGLDRIQKMPDDAPLPYGCDAGVLTAWHEVGKLFSRGIESIELTLNLQSSMPSTVFTKTGLERIQRRIKEPQTKIRTIEGRLIMADFKEHGARCRVHPSVGEPILCLFDEEQRDEILNNMLHYVRIVGETQEDHFTGKIANIKIQDLQRLADAEDHLRDPMSLEHPSSYDFWESPSLAELALSQNVQPLMNVAALFGSWPGDDHDGFEAAIDELRQHGINEETPS
jgi:hypothetical protein